jgi:hypothetical protein
MEVDMRKLLNRSFLVIAIALGIAVWSYYVPFPVLLPVSIFLGTGAAALADMIADWYEDRE